MVDTQKIDTIFAHNQKNPYTDILKYELNISLPSVDYPGFFVQPDEVLLYAVPASVFQDKEQVVGYTGKSAGASVRVAKGVTLRTGSSGGAPIRDVVRKESPGDFIITNQRVVFLGKDDTFDFSVAKISAVKPLSGDSFMVQSGQKSKNILVDPFLTRYAISFINYAVTSYTNGVNLVAEKLRMESSATEEQKALFDSACQSLREKSMASYTTLKGVPKNKWISFLLCLFLGFFGAHKFYEGRIGLGIVYIFTLGLFGFGWLVDCVLLLCKPNPYYVSNSKQI